MRIPEDLSPRNTEKIDWGTIETHYIEFREKKGLIPFSEEKKKENIFPELWKHQIQAIDAWNNSNFVGIWQMATGSGKTLAAISAAVRFFDNLKEKLLIVVTCPYKVLVDQWSDELYKYQLKTWKLEDNWRKKLLEATNYHIWGKNDITFVVTTYDKLANAETKKMLSKCKNLMLISDEVHNFGSRERQLGMLDEFKFRLGLSATPERWFDEEGSEKIKDYFCGDPIYTYPLEKAIEDGHLVQYDYYPVLVELSAKETQQYAYYTKKFTQFAHLEHDDSKHIPEGLKQLLIARARILKKAKHKIRVFKDLISKDKVKTKRMLVYCSDREQVNEVQAIFNEMGIYRHQRFTESESRIKKKRTGILHKFEKGEIDILVAIKCLDEGLDIPAVENAIIMASTANPREFIQRRGRLLRRFPGKEFSIIYDLIVIPQKSYATDVDLYSIYERELRRYSEFVRTSRNPEKSTNALLEIVSHFGK